MASVVRSKFTLHEPLPAWADKVRKTYLDVLATQGQRLFFYTLLVTTRESRHLKSAAKVYPDLTSKFGEFTAEFNSSIQGSGSDCAASKFQSHPPEGPLGPYVESLEHIFFNGSFSGGYGGKPWGNIAATLRAFVLGETSLEMMVDTAYTLAHNNGPMFNKGMLYSMYTHTIYKILDVQRSGQIPELILNAENEGMKDVKVKGYVSSCLQEMQDELNCFGSYVDWQKVEDLGSLHKYPTEKKNQHKKNPPPVVPPKPEEVKAKPGFEGHKFLMQWDVFPGQKVNMYTREAV